jgi:putative oxidoreductase
MTIFILGRIIFGAYFLISGFNHFSNEQAMTGYAKSKGVTSSRLAVLGTGALLVLGGLGFILNMYLQISVILLLVFLIPTTFIMHDFWNVKDPMHKMGERVNFMKNIALIGALMMML